MEAALPYDMLGMVIAVFDFAVSCRMTSHVFCTSVAETSRISPEMISVSYSYTYLICIFII